VSRAYINKVNVTNTTVTVTKITSVYNTQIVSRGTNVNHIMYVNQRVTNGVTVVSHGSFVNARPVAQNMMKVDAREIAAAPITHVVAAEPIRASVIGGGRPASVRPPAAVISRTVVAVRTPPPPPHPIEQRQAQAGGHLNQQAVVRPVGAAQPAQMNAGGRPTPTPTKDGFRPFTQPDSGNSQVRQMPQTQPRTYEQQGTPEPRIRRGKTAPMRSLPTGRLRNRRIRWFAPPRRCRSAARSRNSSKSRSSINGTSSGPLLHQRRRRRHGLPSRNRRSRPRRVVDADGRFAM